MIYTADVLFLLLHLCRFTPLYGLSVRVSAKEISSPAGYTKHLFDNSTKTIFVLENIFCGKNLIKTFLKPEFFFFNLKLVWDRVT